MLMLMPIHYNWCGKSMVGIFHLPFYLKRWKMKFENIMVILVFLSNTIQHYPTLSNTIQHYPTLSNTIQHIVRVFIEEFASRVLLVFSQLTQLEHFNRRNTISFKKIIKFLSIYFLHIIYKIIYEIIKKFINE